MAKAMTEEVLIGKFDILATYTYAKALLDDEPEFRRDHLDERDDPNRIIGGLVSDLAQGVRESTLGGNASGVTVPIWSSSRPGSHRIPGWHNATENGHAANDLVVLELVELREGHWDRHRRNPSLQ
jgi:hypothetical protein